MSKRITAQDVVKSFLKRHRGSWFSYLDLERELHIDGGFLGRYYLLETLFRAFRFLKENAPIKIDEKEYDVKERKRENYTEFRLVKAK